MNLNISLEQNSGGHLDLIIGPMIAGKTTEILRRLSIASELGLKCLYINHKIDDRAGEKGHFSTHNPLLKTTFGDKIAVIYTDKLSDIDVLGYQLIAIDEGQFFQGLKEDVLRWVNEEKRNVIIGGLVLDFRRKKFGEIGDLIGHANNIILLKPFCKKCLGKDPPKLREAMYTQRLDGNSDNQIVVGGIDKYFPVCRTCYEGTNS